MIHRRFIRAALIMALLSTAVVLGLFIALARTNAGAKGIAYLANSLAPTPGATVTTTAQTPNGNGDGLNPAIIAAIVAGLIAGAFGVFGIVYGTRQQQKLLRYQKELDKQEKANEQEEQRKTATLEEARREMVLAQNTAERDRAYRRALHVDPRISQLQILDMSRPLEVTSVYVRVRVHEEARLRYDLDPLMTAAEKQRDPNARLRAGQKYVEHRVSTALDPDEAIRKYKRSVIVGDPGAVGGALGDTGAAQIAR